MRFFAALLVLSLATAGCAADPPRTVVAAGTTLVDSGFMDALAEAYKAEFPETQISVVGRSTAEVIALGGAGSADLLITHTPQLEQQFIASGRSERDAVVFTSRFVLVAPPVVAEMLAGKSLEQALLSLVDRTVGAEFVSRGDNSGTHLKELDLWDSAGWVPHEAAWYLETGQGMGATLQVASQKGAVAFTEYGAFLATQGLDLVEVQLAGPQTQNPYTAIVPSGANNTATHFLDWLLLNKPLIEQLNEDLFGEQIYRP